MATSPFTPATLSPEDLAIYNLMAENLQQPELACCLANIDLVKIIRSYDFSEDCVPEGSPAADDFDAVRIMKMASAEYQDLLKTDTPPTFPTLKQRYDEYIGKLRFEGKPLLSAACPICCEQIETLAAPAGNQWDTASECPHCGEIYWKTVTETVFQALPLEEPVTLATPETILDAQTAAPLEPLPYIAEALAALRFCQSVIMDIHGDCEITDLITEVDEDELEAPELYYALQEVVAFLEEEGCYDLSEQVAHAKASTAMLGFPDIPCAFEDDLDGSEKDFSQLAERLPTPEELVELKRQIDAIPDVKDLYPYNRI